MPRLVDPVLRQLLERVNPRVQPIVEVSAPDVAQVFRRADDQFLLGTGSGGPRVSETPAASSVRTESGGLTLTSTLQTVAQRYHNDGSNVLGPFAPERFLRGVGWQLDQNFRRATLKRFTALIQRTPGVPGTVRKTDFALQVYRAVGTAGVLQRRQGTSLVETPFIDWSFVPLLPEPAVVKYDALVWTLVSGSVYQADVAFDLTPYQLVIENRALPVPTLTQSGEMPVYYFVVSATQKVLANTFDWRTDATSPTVVAGVGTFQQRTWARANPDDPASPWLETVDAASGTCRFEIDQYVASSQDVYQVTLPAVPAAGSTGRIVFERSVPVDTAATLELSTAGSGGPWTPVKHGDLLAVRQQTYHLRVTLTASADQRSAPALLALGIEYRTATDLSAEATVTPLARAVDVPFLQAAIGEGDVTLVRTGRRDYRDPGADVVTAHPDTQLEVDCWLGSLHPKATRDTWLHVDRAVVSARTPTPTAERLSLLSYAKTLKRKIPARVEQINQIHTVVSATLNQVQVAPNLVGTTVAGNEYDGAGYYLRVRSSTQAGVETGYLQTIDGNTGLDRLDFTTPLPGALAPGDVVEVHSGTYAQPVLSWQDADPADVWWEILTVHLGVPAERIGLAGVGHVGRAGLPPRVTDRAPGDAATQAKLCVTRKITEATNADELLDQLSFLMGGATIEVAGQIVFRQIYPLREATGAIVVPGEPAALVLDPRDIISLETPTGREHRITTLACDYGVNQLAASQDTQQAKTVVFADPDAVATYSAQELQDLGYAAVPDAIAAWCYNSADEGLYLAESAAQQVVLAASTGLRVWPLTTTEQHPELLPGDTVVVITDQYTDYDPTAQRAVRGWWAYPLVLVSVENMGRSLRGLLLGLGSAIPIAGGDGTLTPPDRPGTPQVTAVIDASGHLRVTVTATEPEGAGFRVAWDSAAIPSEATVDAAAWQPGSSVTLDLGSVAGATTAFVAVKAYTAQTLGVGSLLASARTQLTVAAPMATLTETANDLTHVVFAGSGQAAAGASAGALQWRSKLWADNALEPDYGGWTAFPAAFNITRLPVLHQRLRFEVMDSDGRVSLPVEVQILAKRDLFDPPSGLPKRSYPWLDGGYTVVGDASDPTGLTAHASVKDATLLEIRRGLKKLNPGDTNDFDGVPEGTAFRRTTANEKTGAGRAYPALDSGGFLVTGARATALIVDRAASEVARRTSRFFAESFDSLPSAATGWTVQGATMGLQSDTNATMGTNVLTTAGYVELRWSTKLAFNPRKLYRMRVRVRTVSYNPTGATHSLWYAGLIQYDYLGNPTNTNGGAGYICAAGYDPGEGPWVEYIGWFQGASQPFTTPGLGVSADGQTPVALNVGTVTIAPYLLIGYDGTGGSFLVDYVLIDEYDEDSSGRVFGMLQSDRTTLYGTVRDDTTLAVNRGLKKLSAGDPNTADAFQSLQGSVLRIPGASWVDASLRPLIDFSLGAHLNKTLAYIADDTVGDRRATSANGKTGGERVFPVIDAGSVLTAAGLDFARGYTNKHAGNLPRAAGGASVQSVLTYHGDTGHALTGYQDATGLTVERGLKKLNAGDPNTADALGLIPGSSYQVTTLNEKTGAGRAYPALDTSGYIVTGVRATATIGADRTAADLAKRAGAYFVETFDVIPSAANGWIPSGAAMGLQTDSNASMGQSVLYAGGYLSLIWSTRLPFNPRKLYRMRARIRTAAYNAGGAGASLIYVGVLQANYAGSPTNSNSGAGYVCAAGADPAAVAGFGDYVEYVGWFKGASAPFASGTGSSSDAAAPVALNAGTVTIQPYVLLGYNGTGGTFLIDYLLIDEYDEDGSARTYGTIASPGLLRDGTQALSGVTARVISKGYQAGTAQDGNTVTFPQAFQGVPYVDLVANMAMQGDSTKWPAGFSATKTTYMQLVAQNVTALSFTLKAKLRQKGTQTAANDNFVAGSATTAGQSTPSCALGAHAPASGDSYTVRGRLVVTVTVPRGLSGTNTVVVALMANDGTQVFEVARFTKSAQMTPQINPNGGTTTNTFDLSATVVKTGMDPSDTFFWKIISVTPAGDYSAYSQTLTGNTGSNNNGLPGCSYYYSTGDIYATMTPDPDDAIAWSALEVSS